MHRHARLLLPLLILICASCASPAALSSRSPSAERVKAPIVTSNGALPPRAAERVVEQRLEDLHDSEHVRELIDAFRESAAAPLVAGNRVTLLVDGPKTLTAIRNAIESAHHHVHLETYIFADDEVGRALRDLLIRRRQEGVEVRVLYDAIGSVTTPAAFFEPMRQAGVEVLQFRPLNPTRTMPWKLNNRDHRKIVVVDGRVAFTGGINISSTYASSSSLRPGPKNGQEEAWRDTHVEIEGPAAAQFQTLFVKIWERAGGKLSDASAQYFPPLAPGGAELVAAVASSGGDRHETTIYDTYVAAIGHASSRLWMTQAYFAPDPALRQALIAAARRGVDVRVIVPSFSDSALIFHASRADYDELLAGGVRIYEQRYAMLHAKSMVIDSALSMVGSANFDIRSFLHNNEVNAVVVGSEFAERMEALFQRDLGDTRELQLKSWRKRPWLDRFKELTSSLFSYWL
ncbi:MAG TPA: cardiolipin synthase [Steroidobacteraceae bacterium]|nr:cardiolipin synthase [Steroidobacteraceae bacterium]